MPRGYRRRVRGGVRGAEKERPLLSAALLPARGTFIGLLFLTVIGLNLLEKRFWCKFLCPLGALLGVLSRYSVLKRSVTEDARPAGPARQSARAMRRLTSARDGKARNASCAGTAMTSVPHNAVRFGFGRGSRQGRNGPRQEEGSHVFPDRRLCGAAHQDDAPHHAGLQRPEADPPSRVPGREGFPEAVRQVRRMHEGLHDERPPAHTPGSGPGRHLVPGPRPPDRLLRVPVHALRTGLPDRGDQSGCPWRRR
ncbi:MAG: 4Fe-4S binding protein [Desulfosudis oleivorans]|nr:4Fe-4S binding protein [Desulfosudis oleivorans]